MQLSKKQIGILWMSVPFVALAVILAVYAVSSFGLTASVQAGMEGQAVSGFAKMLHIILGVLGVVALVGSIIGIPLGLYFFSRVESHEVANLARRSAYEHLSESQVEYIAKWSWSSFFLKWVWTLSNRGVRFWTLGLFTPILGYYFMVKLAMHGRRMSWESGKWKSFKEFRKRQAILAVVAWLMPIVWILFFTFVFAKIPKMIMSSVLPQGFTSQVESGLVKEEGTLNSDALTATLCQGLEDLDQDGLIDKYEVELNAKASLKDTDGDGFSDGEELENGYDPGGPGAMSEKQRRLYLIEKSQAKQCL